MAHPVIGRCPICNDTLEVTTLHCRTCDTTIQGHFSLGRFYQLTPEQLEFAETFIRCEGKINRVEDELGRLLSHGAQPIERGDTRPGL